MRCLTHRNPGTQVRRRLLAAWAVAWFAMGVALPFINRSGPGMSGALVLGFLFLLLPSTVAILYLIARIASGEERAAAPLLTTVRSYGFLALAVVASIGACVATDEIYVRLALARIESTAGPLIQAIEQHRNQTGRVPLTLNELDPTSSGRALDEIAGWDGCYRALEEAADGDGSSWELEFWGSHSIGQEYFCFRPRGDYPPSDEHYQRRRIGRWMHVLVHIW